MKAVCPDLTVGWGRRGVCGVSGVGPRSRLQQHPEPIPGAAVQCGPLGLELGTATKNPSAQPVRPLWAWRASPPWEPSQDLRCPRFNDSWRLQGHAKGSPCLRTRFSQQGTTDTNAKGLFSLSLDRLSSTGWLHTVVTLLSQPQSSLEA